MNKDQFIYWLKGFAKAVNEEGPTLGQWGIITSELNKIQDCPDYSSPIDLTDPFPKWQEPHYVNPWNKYTGTMSSGSTYNGIVTYGNTSWTNIVKDANVSYTTNQLELDLE